MTQLLASAISPVNFQPSFTAPRKNVDVPMGLWLACPGCSEMIYRKEMEDHFHTCPRCEHHFRVSARQRVAMLVDTGTFEEADARMVSADPISFNARKSYKQQLIEAQKASGSSDAVITRSPICSAATASMATGAGVASSPMRLVFSPVCRSSAFRGSMRGRSRKHSAASIFPGRRAFLWPVSSMSPSRAESTGPARPRRSRRVMNC